MSTKPGELQGYTALVFLFAAAGLTLTIDGVRQGGQERTFALLVSATPQY